MKRTFLYLVLVGFLCFMVVLGCAKFKPIVVAEDGGVYRFNMERREELIEIADGAAGEIPTDSNVIISYNIKKYEDEFVIRGVAVIPEVPARSVLHISFYAVIGDEKAARVEKILEKIYFKTEKKPTEFGFEVRATDQDVYFCTLFQGYASWEAYKRVLNPSICQGGTAPLEFNKNKVQLARLQ
jgi:hypothetical protein